MFNLINSEEPHLHWGNINVSGKRVLDLGCGDFGNVSSLEYPSTLEYFLEMGAAYVIGVDLNIPDLQSISNIQHDKNKFEIQEKGISSSEDVLELIKSYNVDIVKCDIEGSEIHLLNIPDEIFSSISQYYIETHGDELYRATEEKLLKCGYDVYNRIDLTHTNGNCKVLFAKKI